MWVALGVPTTASIIVRVRFPAAIFDCASDVTSHSTYPVGGTVPKVVRVISVVEQVGALFHVEPLSENEAQGYAATVRDWPPEIPARYIDKSVEVGVIFAGNGISFRSNSIRILDSPPPVAPMPRNSVISLPRLVLALVESIVLSGTEGRIEVLANILPRFRFKVRFPVPSSSPSKSGILKLLMDDQLLTR